MRIEKKQTIEDLLPLKFEVKDKSTEEIRTLLFNNGFRWNGYSDSLVILQTKYIFLNKNKKVLRCSASETFYRYSDDYKTVDIDLVLKLLK